LSAHSVVDEPRRAGRLPEVADAPPSAAAFIRSASDQLQAESMSASEKVAALKRAALSPGQAQAVYGDLLAHLEQIRTLAQSISAAATAGAPADGAATDGVPPDAVRLAARLGRHFDATEQSPAEASHWARLYEDLAELERDLLARSRRHDGTGDGQLDTELLESSVRRLEERSHHWREVAWARQGVARDDETRALRWRDRELHLTRREYALVTTLMDNPGRKLSARHLVQRAWGSAALSTEQLRTYVARLRASAAQAGIPINIVTDRGRGYSIELVDGAEAREVEAPLRH